MSRLKWFIAGVGLGVLAIKQINENPKARRALDEAINTAKEFTAAVTDGFVEREAELKKPAAKKSTTAKPATKKPAAKKPVATKRKPAAK